MNTFIESCILIISFIYFSYIDMYGNIVSLSKSAGGQAENYHLVFFDVVTSSHSQRRQICCEKFRGYSILC